MSIKKVCWTDELICIHPSENDASSIAEDVYERTCRTDFAMPGFCIVKLGRSVHSAVCRQLMLDLKTEMSKIHHGHRKCSLNYLSAARFDQQETTRLHLDGGPEECFLMLGYEPSEVDSLIEICDYTQCAYDLGLAPEELMKQHNPMFHPNSDVLSSYTMPISCFSADEYQIICINNSSAKYEPENPKWQGTLHTATILTPDESKRRVVNSTMISSVPAGTADSVSPMELREFATTTSVRRKGYYNPHLEDDA